MEQILRFEFTTAAKAPSEPPRARGVVLVDENGCVWVPNGLGGHSKR